MNDMHSFKKRCIKVCTISQYSLLLCSCMHTQKSKKHISSNCAAKGMETRKRHEHTHKPLLTVYVYIP